MRTPVLALLVACGGPPAAPVGNTGTPRPAPQVEAEPEGDCESRLEAWPAGHHDRYAFEDPATNLFGFKDGKGNVVIAPTYRHVYEFGPGGVAAAIDGTTPFVYLAPDGRVIARAYAFDNGPDYFQEGIARIVDARKKIGYMTERGEIIVPPQYDEAGPFCHGAAEVVLAGAAFSIDREGRKTQAPKRSD